MISRDTKSIRRWRAALVISLAVTATIGGVAATRLSSPTNRLRRAARAVLARTTRIWLQSASAEASPIQRADAPLVMFDEGLASGWEDWSWADHNLTAATRAHRGKQSLSVAPVAYKGVYLHHGPLHTAGYGSLQLFVFGDSAISVALADAGGKFPKLIPLNRYLKAAPGDASGWRLAQVPLEDLGVSRSGATITGVVFQAASDQAQPVVFFDEISLQPDPALPLAPASATVAVTVDLKAGQHPISPYIYGMAFAPPDYLTDLRLGLNRWGGNHTSRYNWVHGNACSAARDWRWANRIMLDGVANQPSSAADAFITRNSAAGAQTLLTIPTLGWVAKNADNDTTSVNVPQEGGAPLGRADGAVAGYDPRENRRRTSLPSAARKGSAFSERPEPEGPIFQDEWVHHLVGRFGSATNGGVPLYAMDNEIDLWDSTHTDVHPTRMGYDDVLQNFLEYSTAVKAVDPGAKITGPVSWGWIGYLYSSLDRGADNFHTHADRRKHGDVPFLPWFLRQVRKHDEQAGKRTLDVLDVHYYPQSGGLYDGSGGKNDPAAQALRVRSTRSLWDSSYVDESWIAESIHLIPRLKEWIAADYPGTEIGISEWNFGGDGDISGALAIADVLGIYGREGVYFANYWDHPKKGSPGYLAFKLYRNADESGHGFGNRSCRASSTAPEQLSCYAATDASTGELTLVLVNKLPKTSAVVPITVQRGGEISTGKLWSLTAASPDKIQAAALPAPVNGRVTLRLPPYSATLLRLHTGAARQ